MSGLPSGASTMVPPAANTPRNPGERADMLWQIGTAVSWTVASLMPQMGTLARTECR